VAQPVNHEARPGTFPSRATKTISLVLVSSSLLLAGCGGTTSTCEEDPNLPRDKQKTCNGSRTRYHGPGRSHVYVGSSGGRVVSRAGNGAGVGASPHGGFGAMGHAATGA
jgi:hypothetical protein